MLLVFHLLACAAAADPAATHHAHRGQGGGRDTSSSADTAGDTAQNHDTGPAPITASALLAALGDCVVLDGTDPFANNDGGRANVSLCDAPGVVWFTSDFDVDCDGGSTSACKDDPYYQPETSAYDSHGHPLDASTLNFAVLPLDSNGFTLSGADLHLGGVVAVLYKGQLAWAVLGDRGPRGAVGEGSYALAAALGIDPDPVSGGAEGGATFVFFTGKSAIVEPIEDAAAAAVLGETEARQLLGD